MPEIPFHAGRRGGIRRSANFQYDYNPHVFMIIPIGFSEDKEYNLKEN